MTKKVITSILIIIIFIIILIYAYYKGLNISYAPEDSFQKSALQTIRYREDLYFTNNNEYSDDLIKLYGQHYSPFFTDLFEKTYSDKLSENLMLIIVGNKAYINSKYCNFATPDSLKEIPFGLSKEGYTIISIANIDNDDFLSVMTVDEKGYFNLICNDIE